MLQLREALSSFNSVVAQVELSQQQSIEALYFLNLILGQVKYPQVSIFVDSLDRGDLVGVQPQHAQ